MNGFYGSAFGNILGTLYFLLFQCVGFLYIKRIFPKKGLLFHLLTGSVSGSVLLQWIPALFAFFFGFSMTLSGAAAGWHCGRYHLRLERADAHLRVCGNLCFV